MLGTYIWLALLTVASTIAMGLILKDQVAFGSFVSFFLWFAIVPVVLGLIIYYRLYRRDHHPQGSAPAEEEPEYKKYLRRD